MNCRNCGGEEFSQDDLGYTVCDICGVQSLVATQEQAEYQEGQEFGRRRKVRRANAAATGPMVVASTITKVVLQTYQSVLLKQVC